MKWQKKVKVELKESALLGGKRCVFEIRILDAAKKARPPGIRSTNQTNS
jgi:hypothetical protein